MASARFEPANLGTKGQHATPRPPKPSRENILFQNCMYNRPASFAGLHVMVLLICGRIIVLHVTDILCLIRYCYSSSVIFLRTSMQIHMYFKVGHDPNHVLHQ